MKRFNFFVLLCLILGLNSCKKICKEEMQESSIVVRNWNTAFAHLEQSNDNIWIFFDGVISDERCIDWVIDSTNTCNNSCGQATIGTMIKINSDTLFYRNFCIEGCKLIQKTQVLDLRYNNMEVVFESLEPYPVDLNNLDYNNYEATFKIRQVLEVCE